MNIKELLERDIKNAWGRIWNKAKTEIPPSEAKELARLALEKAIAYKKLREIVDMLPEIKQLMIWAWDTPAEKATIEMMEKIEKWEQ